MASSRALSIELDRTGRRADLGAESKPGLRGPLREVGGPLPRFAASWLRVGGPSRGERNML